jgi:hypothetical protein
VNPLVSAVIVSFRSRDTLPACLDSLRACRERVPLEVVVVDNASGDGTPELLREAYPDVAVIANPDNRGFTRGVNQGLERASGRCLLLLNPDCIVAPEALDRLLAVLEARPHAAAVAPMLLDERRRAVRSCGRFPTLWTLFCDHLGLAQKFPDSPLFGHYKYGGRALVALDRVDWASGAALLLPRQAYERVGGLDEKIFMYMEEVDWCRRAAHAGLSIQYVPAATVLHHGQRSSRQVPGETYLHNLRSRVYYFRKHHGVLAAGMAKGILLASLALKWCASVSARARRARAEIYAAGMEAVWAA